MSDEPSLPTPRPAPQFGEYATPEEVAAARGISYPVFVPDPGVPAAGPATTPVPAAARDLRLTPADRGRRFDPTITIALLVFGAVNVIQTAPLYLEFDNLLEISTDGTPLGKIDFGEAARVGGYWLLAISITLMLAAVVISFARLRRSRIAFWVPLTAAGLMLIATFATMIVVLSQTPGAFRAVG